MTRSVRPSHRRPWARSLAALVIAACSTPLGGCSVLVNPDPSRLPQRDGQHTGGDGMGGEDGGMSDDASTGDDRLDPLDVQSPPMDVPNGTDVVVTADVGCACPGGQTCCSGACRTVSNDSANCGRCGNVCPPRPNATPVCVSGNCMVGCNRGFGDCDGNSMNGCETNTATSSENCGRCGNRCPGGGGCFAGACSMLTCPTGFADCDGNAANACETALNVREHCGSCTHACTMGYDTCLPSSSVGLVCCRPVTGACGDWNCSAMCRRSATFQSFCCER